MEFNPEKQPCVLSIAGSDSSGGAGIQADLKTMDRMGCYGASVITAVTAQNTLGIMDIYPVALTHVRLQLETVVSDFEFRALKTGMLPSAVCITLVEEIIQSAGVKHVVIDPVLRSTSGADLGDDRIAAYKGFFRLATCITPNIPEAEQFTGLKIDTLDLMKKACAELMNTGCKAVFLTGGHLERDEIADVLFDGIDFTVFRHPKVNTPNLHGTGCVISSAIACGLAQRLDIKTAVANAVQFVQSAIEHSRSFKLGSGNGPVLI